MIETITKQEFDNRVSTIYVQRLHISWKPKYEAIFTDGERVIYKVKSKKYLEPWMSQYATFE